MERNEPVCIASSVEERFLDTYSLNEKTREWQDLEEFWDAGRHRVQSFDGKLNPISNSLENQFMFENYFNESQRKKSVTEFPGVKNESKTVNGINSKDIPTNYSIIGFKPNELVVIGTYVDKNIVPGFQYKVRKNYTDDHLFNGNALTLENVGLGYGKRLTFQGRTLNNSKNYFWSDSHEHGFGFIFQAISPDVIFRIIDTKINRDIGTITINNPARSADIEIATDAQSNGQINKTVKVHFSGDVILNNSCLRQNIFYEDMEIHGTAEVHRPDFNSKAKINKIVLQNFLVEDCVLVLEE